MQTINPLPAWPGVRAKCTYGAYRRALQRQLERRNLADTLLAWAGNERFFLLHSILSSAAAYFLDWPNCLFIPEDSLFAVMSEPDEESMQQGAVLVTVERALGMTDALAFPGGDPSAETTYLDALAAFEASSAGGTTRNGAAEGQVAIAPCGEPALPGTRRRMRQSGRSPRAGPTEASR
jgi:hypothetical protein